MDGTTATPRASIVVPTWNRRALVVETIESCLAQTVEAIEVIVVDDASTDDTVACLRSTYDREPRVRLLPLATNVGLASARNHGIEHARGDVITLLDSDDLYVPRFVEAHLGALDAHPAADLSVSDAHYDGSWPAHWTTVYARQRPPTSGAAMCAGAWMLPSCVAIRAPVLQALRFEGGRRLLEDNEFWFRFFDAGHRVHILDEVLTRYRRFGGEAGAAALSADKHKVREAALLLEERYAHLAADPRRHHARLARRRAAHHLDAGESKAAAHHAAAWWRARPWDLRAAWTWARARSRNR